MSVIEVCTSDRFFNVVHKAYCTDDIGYRNSIVEARNEEEAIEIFNAVAATRRHYPFSYSDAISVEPMKYFSRQSSSVSANASFPPAVDASNLTDWNQGATWEEDEEE